MPRGWSSPRGPRRPTFFRVHEIEPSASARLSVASRPVGFEMSFDALCARDSALHVVDALALDGLRDCAIHSATSPCVSCIVERVDPCADGRGFGARLRLFELVNLDLDPLALAGFEKVTVVRQRFAGSQQDAIGL